MNKKFLCVSVVTIALSLAQPSMACTGQHCDKNPRFGRLAQELNLTAEQKAKIKAYKHETHAQFKSNREQLKSLHMQINNIAKGNTLDEAKLDSLIEQMNKIKGSMLKRRIMIQHEMYSVLNAQQKAKFLEATKNR